MEIFRRVHGLLAHEVRHPLWEDDFLAFLAVGEREEHRGILQLALWHTAAKRKDAGYVDEGFANVGAGPHFVGQKNLAVAADKGGKVKLIALLFGELPALPLLHDFAPCGFSVHGTGKFPGGSARKVALDVHLVLDFDAFIRQLERDVEAVLGFVVLLKGRLMADVENAVRDGMMETGRQKRQV